MIIRNKNRNLRRKLEEKGSCQRGIQRRLNKAQGTFNILRKIWPAKEFSNTTKNRIFNTNTKCVIPYGCETWNANKIDIIKIVY